MRQIRQSSDRFEDLVVSSILVVLVVIFRNPILAQALGVLFGGLALLGAASLGLLVFIVQRKPKESGQRFGIGWIEGPSNRL